MKKVKSILAKTSPPIKVKTSQSRQLKADGAQKSSPYKQALYSHFP